MQTTLGAAARAPDNVRLRHGLTDQKAPQAHAQEEAQEAAEEDPLAASSAGQVGSDRPSGRSFRVQPVWPTQVNPSMAAATRASATRAAASSVNSTAYDDPLPARIAGA